MTLSAFFQHTFHHIAFLRQALALNQSGILANHFISDQSREACFHQMCGLSSHFIKGWTYFLMKDQGKEVIFREGIQELKKEWKGWSRARLIDFLHHKPRRWINVLSGESKSFIINVVHPSINHRGDRKQTADRHPSLTVSTPRGLIFSSFSIVRPSGIVFWRKSLYKISL